MTAAPPVHPTHRALAPEHVVDLLDGLTRLEESTRVVSGIGALLQMAVHAREDFAPDALAAVAEVVMEYGDRVESQRHKLRRHVEAVTSLAHPA